jgi:hypothetical protein
MIITLSIPSKKYRQNESNYINEGHQKRLKWVTRCPKTHFGHFY